MKKAVKSLHCLSNNPAPRNQLSCHDLGSNYRLLLDILKLDLTGVANKTNKVVGLFFSLIRLELAFVLPVSYLCAASRCRRSDFKLWKVCTDCIHTVDRSLWHRLRVYTCIKRRNNSSEQRLTLTVSSRIASRDNRGAFESQSRGVRCILHQRWIEIRARAQLAQTIILSRITKNSFVFFSTKISLSLERSPVHFYWAWLSENLNLNGFLIIKLN